MCDVSGSEYRSSALHADGLAVDGELSAIHVAGGVALVRSSATVEDDEGAVGIDVHVARPVDAPVVHRPDQDPPVPVRPVDRVRPRVLDVVVVARVAVRAVEEDL